MKIIIAALLATAPLAAQAGSHHGGYHWPTHSSWHYRLADDSEEADQQRQEPPDRPIYDKDGHYRGYEDSHGQIYDEHGNYNGYEYGKV